MTDKTMKIIARETLVLISIILISHIVFAGEIIELSCTKCGYKEGGILDGVGMLGYGHTVVYCESCKTFYSIPTYIEFETKYNKRKDIIKAVGRDMFLGKDRFVYKCPTCGGKAYDYSEPLCPICQKGEISKKAVGLWD